MQKEKIPVVILLIFSALNLAYGIIWFVGGTISFFQHPKTQQYNILGVIISNIPFLFKIFFRIGTYLFSTIISVAYLKYIKWSIILLPYATVLFSLYGIIANVSRSFNYRGVLSFFSPLGIIFYIILPILIFKFSLNKKVKKRFK